MHSRALTRSLYLNVSLQQYKTRIVLLTPFVLDSRVAQRLFQPLPYPIEHGLASRAQSEVTRWTMYVGAMVMEALLNGYSRQNFVDWIERFHGQIVSSHPSLELTLPELQARLAGLRDVSALFCIGLTY